jgi:hypothetical protein
MTVNIDGVELEELFSVKVYAKHSDSALYTHTSIQEDMREHLLGCEGCRKHFAFMLSKIALQLTTEQGVRDLDGTHDVHHPKIEISH